MDQNRIKGITAYAIEQLTILQALMTIANATKQASPYSEGDAVRAMEIRLNDLSATLAQMLSEDAQ